MSKNSYDASTIEVLKGLDPVRKRPGMYIGSTSRSGLNHLIQEIIDNSVDEHLAGFCSRIYVGLNEDGSATISDNGRGLPVEIHPTEKVSATRVIFSTLHAGGKFSNNAYKISGGLHGVGSSVVNALSKKLIVEVYRDGYVYTDTYERGVPTTKLENGLLPKVKLPNAEKKRTGTRVTLYPDEARRNDMLELHGKYNSCKVFTNNVDNETISQLINLLNQPYVADSQIRIMPDTHAGAGCVIGTTMTLTDKVCANLGSSGEHMDNKLSEWIAKLNS